MNELGDFFDEDVYADFLAEYGVDLDETFPTRYFTLLVRLPFRDGVIRRRLLTLAEQKQAELEERKKNAPKTWSDVYRKAREKAIRSQPRVTEGADMLRTSEGGD